MTRHDPKVRLHHMLDHAKEAIELLGSKTIEPVQDDRTLQLALTRLVEVVGEAASKIPPPTNPRAIRQGALAGSDDDTQPAYSRL